MIGPHMDSHGALRRLVYWILIVAAVGSMSGRIMAVRSEMGGTPLLSANDRSRWSTVRALVDYGTYAIDDVIFKSSGARDREWYTIDMVKHRGRDGREHYYSSKPPLLATLLAAPYWLLRTLTGASLADEPFYVVRVILLMVNVLPLALYFVMLARLVEQYGTSDFGRIFVMTCATWGTFLTTFAVTLNNHIFAAVSVLGAVCAALPLWTGASRAAWRYFIAGGAAAFAVTSELPALSFFALLAAALFWQAPARTVLYFLPAAAVIAAAFWITNYVAHASWRPPYAHRGIGPFVTELDETFTPTNPPAPQALQTLRQELAESSVNVAAAIELKQQRGRWMLWDAENQQRLALVQADGRWRVHAWDDWYSYEGSYWTEARRTGVDRGEPSRLTYAFHVLVGHHGIFSLTPVWLLSACGLVLWLFGVSRETASASVQRDLAAMVLVLSVVCLTFYLARPLVDRNYGGVTNGFRWMFWFIPLWLVVMLPAADAAANRPLRRAVALAALLISIFSASYTPLNPWSHPWIYRYWQYIEWIS